jgi:hypothetical protein
VVSVYSPLNREEETDYALGVATKCLDIFNNFFGISYCLPKLDLIAVSCISVGKFMLLKFLLFCLMLFYSIFGNFRALVCHSFPHGEFLNSINEIEVNPTRTRLKDEISKLAETCFFLPIFYLLEPV